MQKVLDVVSKVKLNNPFNLNGVNADFNKIVLMPSDDPDYRVPYYSRKAVNTQHVYLFEDWMLVLAFAPFKTYAVISFLNDEGKWSKVRTINITDRKMNVSNYVDPYDTYRLFMIYLFLNKPADFYIFYNRELAQRSFDLSNSELTDNVRPWRAHPNIKNIANAIIWPLVDEITIQSQSKRHTLHITPDFVRDLNFIRQDL